MGMEERRRMEIELKIDMISRDIEAKNSEKKEIMKMYDEAEKPEEIEALKKRIEEISVEITRLKNQRAILRKELERIR